MHLIPFVRLDMGPSNLRIGSRIKLDSLLTNPKVSTCDETAVNYDLLTRWVKVTVLHIIFIEKSQLFNGLTLL